MWPVASRLIANCLWIVSSFGSSPKSKRAAFTYPGQLDADFIGKSQELVAMVAAVRSAAAALIVVKMFFWVFVKALIIHPSRHDDPHILPTWCL